MTRTTVLNVTIGALAAGVIVSAAAWTLLETDDSRAAAPVSVSAVSDVTDDPATAGDATPSDDPTPSDVPTDDSSDPTGPVAVPEGVTVDRAKQIALAARPGSVREVELEDEHGRTAWKVEITGDGGARWEVYVDAVTGEVVRNRSHD